MSWIMSGLHQGFSSLIQCSLHCPSGAHQTRVQYLTLHLGPTSWFCNLEKNPLCCHYCLWKLVASRISLTCTHFGSSWMKPSDRICSAILRNIPIDIVALFRIFLVLAAKAHHHADRIRFLLWWTGCFHVESDGLRGLRIGVEELQFRDPEHAQHTLSLWLRSIATSGLPLRLDKAKTPQWQQQTCRKTSSGTESCRGSEGFHQPWDPASWNGSCLPRIQEITEFLLSKDWRKVWQKHPRQKQREKKYGKKLNELQLIQSEPPGNHHYPRPSRVDSSVQQHPLVASPTTLMVPLS